MAGKKEKPSLLVAFRQFFIPDERITQESDAEKSLKTYLTFKNTFDRRKGEFERMYHDSVRIYNLSFEKSKCSRYSERYAEIDAEIDRIINTL